MARQFAFLPTIGVALDAWLALRRATAPAHGIDPATRQPEWTPFMAGAMLAATILRKAHAQGHFDQVAADLGADFEAFEQWLFTLAANDGKVPPPDPTSN